MKRYTKYQCKDCGKWFKKNKIYFYDGAPWAWQCPNCGSIQRIDEAVTKIRVDYTK